LVVDADGQASLTRTFFPKSPDRTLFDALFDPEKGLPIYRVQDKLSVLPASEAMNEFEDALRKRWDGRSDPRHLLRLFLEAIQAEYDFIVIDPPPGDSLMMRASILAATHIVLVAKPEPLCVDTLTELCTLIRNTREKYSGRPSFAGILLTDVETSSLCHQQGEDIIRRLAKHNGSVFETKIRHSRPLQRAPYERKDIFDFAPRSNGAKDYFEFTQVLLNHFGYERE